MYLATLTSAQKHALLNLAHNVVVSDGELTGAERAMMADMKREMELAQDLEGSYLHIEGIEEIFPTQKARAIALIALIRLAYADGAFEIEEECFLRELADRFEIDSDRFSLIDNWVRRWIALEREANQFL